jgi:hypothetical protein
LAQEIKKELHEFQVEPHKDRKFGVHSHGSLIIKPPNKLLPFEILIENDTEDKVLAVGISGDFDKYPLSPEDKALVARMYERLKDDATANGCDQNNSTTNWPTGWRNLKEGLDDEGLANLLKAQPSMIASQICEQIRSYVKQLEKSYSEAIEAPGEQK